MRKWNIALGFYQNISTANAVFSSLKNQGYTRSTLIHHTRDGLHIHKKHYLVSAQKYLLASFLVIITLLSLFLNLEWSTLSILMGSSLIILGLLFTYTSGVSTKVVNRYKNLVVLDEALILVQVNQTHVRDVLKILRQVKSGHPVTFLLRSEMLDGFDEKINLPKEPLQIEQLSLEAEKLAESLKLTKKLDHCNKRLLVRLKKSDAILAFLRHDIAEAEFIEQTMTGSAEWLLDNTYVIQGAIEEIIRNLPSKYYRQLPKVLGGPLDGLPRIYAIANELVKNTSGKITRENITIFLNSYQTNHPLTIGELWAFPLILRIRLVEWVQSLAIEVDRRMREGESASFWGNRLLQASRREPELFPKIFEELAKDHPTPSPHFAEELLDHLFDEETVLPLARKWLEGHFAIPIADVLHQEQVQETAEQVAFSNAITSLITLSQLSWQAVFESISPVDAIFIKDPAGVYVQMDFNTRNLYRENLEVLSRYALKEETEVAREIIDIAKIQDNILERHIGYYLIDDGRKSIERNIGYKPPLKKRIKDWLTKNPSLVYLGGISFFTLMIQGVLVYTLIQADVGWLSALLFSLLALLPASEIAVQIINFLLTQLLPPTIFPKMSFKETIPEELKTLVVVPMLLHTSEAVREEVDRLEIRYLANPSPSLYFGLFSDFMDAPNQVDPKDAPLIEEAVKGIKALAGKYGEGKFFLFNRQRVWSKCENAWIGDERKRGKLEYLNRFLLGEQLPENIVYEGNGEVLKGVRYVITLDSDTQLPKNQAKQLIEVMAHPLNRPQLSPDGKKVLRGYSIIQPRVCTEFLHTKVSWFSRIFSDPFAVDPYTQAISNVYQDLTGEGTYHGKGIYDVEAFHKVLSKRLPREHVLSHDLIEGAFARVGFASEVCLFDLFPENYLTWANRKHRWMRGDWQIVDWLFPKVPLENGMTEVNPLSLLNRWKIFDNLRRSLMPLSLLILLITSWILAPQAVIWTVLALIVLFIPTITLMLCSIFHFSSQNLLFSLNDLKIQFLRDLISIALLPYEAYSSLDALVKVVYRRMISKRDLLQWSSSKNNKKASSDGFIKVFKHFYGDSLLALFIYAIISYYTPQTMAVAYAICTLWFFSPLIVYLIDKSYDKRVDRVLSESEKQFLRQIARKTWRFFDEFVGPQSNWLPPDNYQEALNVEVAPRTSPTNIGLWLLTALSAYDFKFITLDDLIDRTLATMKTLKKLEHFEGHLLNWYDIHSLKPLYPRYISTVDSGNFLGSLWTLQQGINGILTGPILPLDALRGIQDTLDILNDEAFQNVAFKNEIVQLNKLIYSTPNDLTSLIATFKQALDLTDKLVEKFSEEKSEQVYWLKQVLKKLQAFDSMISRYFGWCSLFSSIPAELLDNFNIKEHAALEVFKHGPSFLDLVDRKFATVLNPIVELSQTIEASELSKQWGMKFKESIESAQWFAGEKMGQISELFTELHQMSEDMNLKYLYNEDRKVFAIGYNVDNCKLDTSYYDLLASEARLASLIAIAKEDVPLEHWWALGRPYGISQGRRVLLSWGGTMFEYLMPLLFNRQYPDSLLGDACINAVACQIAYGSNRGIYWGISESAYSAIDAAKTYQYRSFGVPGLGLKRGLEDDLVVSPYSSALALIVDAPSSVKNLMRMAKKGPNSLLGTYGYYESIDFTRQLGPSGERGVIVYAYMAHHQGMSFISIDNLLNNHVMTHRFHADPRIIGVESILFERIPVKSTVKSQAFKKDKPPSRLVPFSSVPILGVVDTHESVTPKVNLFSNGEYSLMVTNAGGGYSRWKDNDITRWRSDTTQDHWGTFCYIKDVETGKCWSTSFHPTQSVGEQYTTSFKSDKAEFTRKDYQIETITEVVVSPEDSAEIRLITFANLSNKKRMLELTSYAELALAPHVADRAHPCFNKMFIETEALPELSSLLAFRRLRSPNDPPIWAAHIVAVNVEDHDELQYETDRMKFIGRGRSLKDPLALNKELSKTVGTVLDPIFSLRKRIVLEPGSRVQISFVIAVADSREAAISLIKKYKEIAASHRAVDLAWTYAQLQLRHLRIHQEEAQIFQKFASRILYPQSQLRASVDRLRNNKLGQSRLWAQGISGDLPIVVVTLGDIYDVDVVKQVLIAHTFWRLRGLKTDLVILNEESTGYEQPLGQQLQRLVNAYAYRGEVNMPGGVFLRMTDQLPEDELTLILSVARAVIVSARGSLRQQLVSPLSTKTYPRQLIVNKKIKEQPSRELPFLELPYFNGIGGFTPDGKNYDIYLGPNTQTPIPWINVIANPKFGTLVSETGLGCTWYGNSQTNRITPWSNDPVLNSITDTIYIRDEDSGVFWTPTPNPIREQDAYRVSHGQGYSRFEHNSHGIEQELTIFVPLDNLGGEPLRIQKLRLFNNTPIRKRLTVTSYSELVLGDDREESQMHIITEWDPESQSLFAYNRYHPDFGNYLAFASSIPHANSFTGDRREFIGRNGNLTSPSAMKRKALSGQCGAAIDACASIQLNLEIEPGATKEVSFVLGYAKDQSDARKHMANCRNVGAIDQMFATTQECWDKILGTVHVDVPDPSANFLINRWLPYQNLSCRIWGRTAFYQSSGAYGFRDQLQDVMALLYTHPQFAKEHILYAASRQFVEGDVQHWWHAQSGGGIRTRITDDLLWLPFVTAQYVRVTGDISILDEQATFLLAPQLTEDQHEVYSIPEVSKETASLLEHCRRALNKGITSGPHGLPLIGGGDWNDGMNRVGIKGYGESVWLGWFLIHVMNDFAYLLDLHGNEVETGEGFRVQAKRLAEVVESNAWDGEWYLRAYFDNGTPLGSKTCEEAKIDSISQSWAVISGAGNKERADIALGSAEKHLIIPEVGVNRLLTPPFDKTLEDPGYIKGYPPGVRENGGQYTHASIWMAMAYARKGNGNKAVELLMMMNPVNHTRNLLECSLYKVEPYVAPADIYDLPGQVGRGGWTWYTGSAGWMYRVWLEEVLGFKLRGEMFKIDCAIPKEWDHYKLTYHYKSSIYEITVENPDHVSRGTTVVKLDGVIIKNGEVPLADDNLTHIVQVVLTQSS